MKNLIILFLSLEKMNELKFKITELDKDRILTVKVEAEMEVLHEGYQTQGCEKYTEQLSKVSELSPKELALYGRIAVEAMKQVINPAIINAITSPMDAHTNQGA